MNKPFGTDVSLLSESLEASCITFPPSACQRVQLVSLNTPPRPAGLHSRSCVLVYLEAGMLAQGVGASEGHSCCSNTGLLVAQRDEAWVVVEGGAGGGVVQTSEGTLCVTHTHTHTACWRRAGGGGGGAAELMDDTDGRRPCWKCFMDRFKHPSQIHTANILTAPGYSR